MPKNCPPDCECCARSLVAISKAREVYAFLIEISILPSQAPSMRTWDTRLPPSSAMAMFIGCPISAAFFSAAAITRRASSKRTMFSPFGVCRIQEQETGETGGELTVHDTDVVVTYRQRPAGRQKP